jgi:hypothetical protein
MKDFLEQLRIQRFDDHRFYHHSTINQSLHLVSALSFIASYCLLVSMTSRQAGHFFFEPKGYDDVNRVTHEHKEEIKVGYNLRRKVVLMAIWAVSPLVLWFDRGFFGLIEPSTGAYGFVRDVGLLWLALGVGGLVFRVLQLWKQQSLGTGLVWATKIITDPFHDTKLYCGAPLRLLRGELIDPMDSLRKHG